MLHRPALGRQWRERRPLCGSLFDLLVHKKGQSTPLRNRQGHPLTQSCKDSEQRRQLHIGMSIPSLWDITLLRTNLCCQLCLCKSLFLTLFFQALTKDESIYACFKGSPFHCPLSPKIFFNKLLNGCELHIIFLFLIHFISSRIILRWISSFHMPSFVSLFVALCTHGKDNQLVIHSQTNLHECITNVP